MRYGQKPNRSMGMRRATPSFRRYPPSRSLRPGSSESEARCAPRPPVRFVPLNGTRIRASTQSKARWSIQSALNIRAIDTSALVSPSTLAEVTISRSTIVVAADSSTVSVA